MPVRSSLCTYSPAASSALSAGPSSSSGYNSSKYSSILPTTSSLSYGHYKPLGSSTAGATASSSSSSSRRTSFSRPTSHSHQFNYSTLSSPSAASTTAPSSRFSSRYSGAGAGASSSISSSSSSSSSYSPSSPSSASNYSLDASPSGSYKPLDSPAYTSRYGTHLRATGSRYSPNSASSASSSNNSLSSIQHNHLSQRHHDSPTTSAYSAYKCSPSSSSSGSSSAYASGSSLSSTSSGSSLASNYVPKSRRLSHTSYSTSSSLGSHRSSPAVESSPPLPAGVPGGLMNLGNTCYMNASLQALYSIDSFRDLILSLGSSRSSGGKALTSELGKLFETMRSQSSSQAVSPADFKYAFSSYQSKFSGFAQQDAQEFLRYLINGVHEELNRAGVKRLTGSGSASTTTTTSGRALARPAAQAPPKTSQEAWAQYREIVDDSPLVDLLVGQLCSTITCGQCGNKSHCWDPFWDLSLPLSMSRKQLSNSLTLTTSRYTSTSSSSSSSSASLRDVIDEFTARETLDGDERPTCSQCKKPTRSTKQISWSRLPRVLILHLKKFTNDGYKLSSPDIHIDKQLTFNGSTYHLKACISHHGHSSCSGHYTSHCDYSARWFHFDDARVRDVTRSFDCGKLVDAYVLLYTPNRPTTNSLTSNSSSSSIISQSRL